MHRALSVVAPLARLAHFAPVALIVALFACKRDDTTKDVDISSGRKPIAAAGGTKGASKKLEDDDDDDPPAKTPAGPRLESAAGRFRVDFPVGSTLPDEKLVPVPTAIGTVIMHSFMNETEGDAGDTTGASYVDYPPGHVLRSGGESTVLAAVQNGAVTTMMAVLDHSSEITLDGRLARDFTFSFPSTTQYGRQLATLVGDRLYQLIYVSAKGKADVESPRVRAFFASLHITS
jgi:hypothetical protein